MSDPSVPAACPSATDPTDHERMAALSRKFRIAWGTAIVVIALILAGPIEQLMFGWIYFPLRTIPKFTPDWPTAILGSVSVIAFLVMLDRTMKWLRDKSGGSPGRIHWQFRSTVILGVMLVVLFAAGTAMVGATHQMIWMMTGKGGTAEDEAAFAQRRLPSLLDSVYDARNAVFTSMTRNNLKMIGIAFHNTDEMFRAIPPGGTTNPQGELLHGWIAFIGNYHSFQTNGIDFQTPWNVPPNDRLYKCQMHGFLNPSIPGPVFDEEGYGLCHFAGNSHVLPLQTVMPVQTVNSGDAHAQLIQLKSENRIRSLSDIIDGTSNTILAGTVGERFKPWGYPANIRDPSIGINRSPHGFGGAPGWKKGLFLMCDGSVRSLSEKTDLRIMQGLATPDGGEVIEE
ncbi:MAG: DUF1559 domain-containing protein [Planctomycetota bacterium]